MKKIFRHGGGRGSSALGVSALRPAVEAVMLAAVAFGCAHASWSLFAPPAQGAIDASGAEDSARSRLSAEAVEVAAASPFAPLAEDVAATSTAAASFASSVQLVAVRIADDPGRSGAILTMSDGMERAFLVGRPLSDGVVLSRVTETGVLLEYAGGTRELTLAPAPTHDFAAALLGRIEAPRDMTLVSASSSVAPPALAVSNIEPEGATPFATREVVAQSRSISLAPNEETPAAQPDASATSAAQVQDMEAVRFVSALIARAPNGNIPAEGLRLDGPLPAAVAAAGLEANDVIIAVNGSNRLDFSALAAGEGAYVIEFSVQRASAAPIIIRAQMRLPT